MNSEYDRRVESRRHASRQKSANQATAAMGGLSSQDALRAIQSGQQPLAQPIGQSPSAPPAMAGQMNAAMPGVFNGNPANGYSSKEVGFSAPAAAAQDPSPPSTGTWGHSTSAATPGTSWMDAYKPTPGAMVSAQDAGLDVDPQYGDPGYEDWLRYWQAQPGHGGGTINAGLQGYMTPEQLTVARDAPANFIDPSAVVPPMLGDPYNGMGRGASPVEQSGTDLMALQGGSMPRGANWNAGGHVGQGGLALRNQMATPTSTAGMTQIGSLYDGGPTLFRDAQGNEWIQGDGYIEPNQTMQATGAAATDPGKAATGGQGGATLGPSGYPSLLDYLQSGENIDEQAMVKQLGFKPKNMVLPDIETFQRLNITAPGTANYDDFLNAANPSMFVADPGLQKLLGQYSKTYGKLKTMPDDGQPHRFDVEEWQKYNTMREMLSRYGIQWDPMSLDVGDPGSGVPGGGGGGAPGGGGGGGGAPGGAGGGAGGAPGGGGGAGGGAGSFPGPPTGPGAIDWTRNDFDIGNTDVSISTPLVTRINSAIQKMFGSKYANASPEAQAAMIEMAMQVAMADEQALNKQKSINVMQGGYESTLRDNNPLRAMSEDAVLGALQNPNPIDLQGIQNRTSSDYDKGLNQAIQASSGSAARRGLSMGSQAGLAGSLTAANRSDLARTLGEQEMAYQMADRQALYDAINAASGVNRNYLGAELQQRNTLANAIRGAYDQAANPYAGGADTAANLKALEIMQKQADAAGDSDWRDYLGIAGSLIGAAF